LSVRKGRDGLGPADPEDRFHRPRFRPRQNPRVHISPGAGQAMRISERLPPGQEWRSSARSKIGRFFPRAHRCPPFSAGGRPGREAFRLPPQNSTTAASGGRETARSGKRVFQRVSLFPGQIRHRRLYLRRRDPEALDGSRPAVILAGKLNEGRIPLAPYRFRIRRTRSSTFFENRPLPFWRTSL